MMRKLKTRIMFGIGALFLVIILLSLAGSIFVFELARDSRAIIKDNNASVNYALSMLQSLDEIQSLQIEGILFEKDDSLSLLNYRKEYARHLEAFDRTLGAQENNITEPGEAEIAGELRENYHRFLTNFEAIDAQNVYNPPGYYHQIRLKYNRVRTLVERIYDLNMRAILLRNSKAEQTADRVATYISILGSICMAITFWFLVYLPRSVLRPIEILTGKIQEISRRNYDQRLDYPPGNELGEMAEAFNTMAVKLKEYEAQNLDQILFEKKRLEAIIENLDDAVLILDRDQRVISANRAALEVLGLEQARVIGQYAPDIALSNNVIREMIKKIAMPANENATGGHTVEIQENEEKKYYLVEILEINANAADGQQKVLLGHILLLKNITRFEERDAAKTHLMAVVSHELKTPISSINLSLKLLEDQRIGELNREQLELINSIRNHSKRLLKMINEIIEFSRIQSGKIHLDIRTIEPGTIVEFALQTLDLQLKEKQIRVDANISKSLPLIKADPEKTVWILVNIIGNAIRFSPEGETITLSVKQDKHTVVFSVTDKGRGIPAEDQEKLFDKFVRLDNTQSKGSGLGLAISREIITALDGKIWVESEAGAGSTFSFTLPAMAAHRVEGAP